MKQESKIQGSVKNLTTETKKLTFVQIVANYKKAQKLSDSKTVEILTELKKAVDEQKTEVSKNSANLYNMLLNNTTDVKVFIKKLSNELEKYATKVSNKELDEQRKKVEELEKQTIEDKVKATKKDFTDNFGESGINRTIAKALKIAESTSKDGLNGAKIASVIYSTSKDYLQTLTSRIKVSKDNKYFPFLNEVGATGVIGALSVNDLLSIILSSKGILLISEAKFLKACKNTLLLSDSEKIQAFENGIKINRLINSIFKAGANVSEVLNEIVVLTNTEYVKGKKVPKLSISQLDKLEKVANSFYCNAYNSTLPLLHEELLNELNKATIAGEIAKVA